MLFANKKIKNIDTTEEIILHKEEVLPAKPAEHSNN